MFQTKFVEEMKTNFVFNNFFPKRVFYEIMRKSTVERGRLQMTIWDMPISRWISKATDTITVCTTHYFSNVKSCKNAPQN
jgi:hypothetical protein